MPRVLKKYKGIFILLLLLAISWMPVKVSAAPQSIWMEEMGDADFTEELISPSVILMEPLTGQVICEKNADERRSPASITKIMTLILIFDELENGTLSPEDEVTTSAYAKSMGGSQVFLEEGEVQTVDTLIKCIAVASGNDACVAMAEKIAGSEASFVEQMNERAKSLGLTDTHFCDCSGLSDSDDHYTSARDVARMSRELVLKYPKIREYSTIWMEDIVHVTNKGSETFTLSSTNKLLKQYPYTTGLKTGSTNKAGYCLSATAEYEGMELIAVVMGAPDPKTRFSEAKTLLEYGYLNCSLYTDDAKIEQKSVSLKGAVEKEVKIRPADTFTYLNTTGEDTSKITRRTKIAETALAPVREGTQAGETTYYLNDKKIGSVPLVFAEDIEKAVFFDYYKLLWKEFLFR